MAYTDNIKKLVIIAMRNVRCMPENEADDMAEYALIVAKVYHAKKDDNPANLTLPEVWMLVALWMVYTQFKVTSNMAEVIGVSIGWYRECDGYFANTIRGMQIDTRTVYYNTLMLEAK